MRADDFVAQAVRMSSRTKSEQGLLSSARTVGHSLLWAWDHSIGWVVRGIFLVLIAGYQRLISPLLPASCRYHPSCSAYGFEAFSVHGSAKGLVLTAWRLLRCNPWSKGGVNPGPDKNRWLPNIHPDGSTRTGSDTNTQWTLPERRTT